MKILSINQTTPTKNTYKHQTKADQNTVFITSPVTLPVYFNIPFASNGSDKSNSSELFRQDARFVDVSKPKSNIKMQKAKLPVNEYRMSIFSNRRRFPKLYDFIEENQNTTLDDFESLFDGIQYKTFDISDRFAFMVYNTNQKEGTALIYDEIPKIFEGIEKEKIKDAMDNLMLEMQIEEGIKEFKIDGKRFRAKQVGEGDFGIVYKIEDIEGNCAAIKRYISPNSLMDIQGMHCEIPIARKASLDNVNDVPKFYMANPVCDFLQSETKNRLIKGGWMIREFIEEDTKPKNSDINLERWLQNYMLFNEDDKSENYVGNYLIDLGGIGRFEDTCNLHAAIETVFRCLANGHDIPEVLSFLD